MVDEFVIFERVEAKLDKMQETLNELNTKVAVHEVKIGRSSAFYGAVSGLFVAILTGVIINYVSNPMEIQPKVIYKDKQHNETTLQELE